jgi:hypothetical protein
MRQVKATGSNSPRCCPPPSISAKPPVRWSGRSRTSAVAPPPCISTWTTPAPTRASSRSQGLAACMPATRSTPYSMRRPRPGRDPCRRAARVRCGQRLRWQRQGRHPVAERQRDPGDLADGRHRVLGAGGARQSRLVLARTDRIGFLTSLASRAAAGGITSRRPAVATCAGETSPLRVRPTWEISNESRVEPPHWTSSPIAAPCTSTQ